MTEPNPIEALANIDLKNLSAADVAKIDNPVIRNALIQIMKTPLDVAASHQNHGSHGDHSKNAARFLELEFLAQRGNLPKAGEG